MASIQSSVDKEIEMNRRINVVELKSAILQQRCDAARHTYRQHTTLAQAGACIHKHIRINLTITSTNKHHQMRMYPSIYMCMYVIISVQTNSNRLDEETRKQASSRRSFFSQNATLLAEMNEVRSDSKAQVNVLRSKLNQVQGSYALLRRSLAATHAELAAGAHSDGEDYGGGNGEEEWMAPEPSISAPPDSDVKRFGGSAAVAAAAGASRSPGSPSASFTPRAAGSSSSSLTRPMTAAASAKVGVRSSLPAGMGAGGLRRPTTASPKSGSSSAALSPTKRGGGGTAAAQLLGGIGGSPAGARGSPGGASTTGQRGAASSTAQSSSVDRGNALLYSSD